MLKKILESERVFEQWSLEAENYEANALSSELANRAAPATDLAYETTNKQKILLFWVSRKTQNQPKCS